LERLQVRPLVITGEVARKAICRHVLAAPEGYVVKISEPKKKRAQEEKYHAMIGDIAKHCTFMGKARDEETWKRLLIDAYVRVARENAKAEGKPDPFAGQGEVVPSLDGTGIVQLGVQSRRFKVSQAANFIEYLFAYGAEHGVEWSEPTATEERHAA
jgi:hypothetical protein